MNDVMVMLIGIACAAGNKVRMVDAGVVPPLVDALTAHRTNPDVAKAACSALANLAAAGEMDAHSTTLDA